MLPVNMKTKNAVLQIAWWQLGIAEVPAGSNRVKYNDDYYGRSVSGAAYPWCMAFVWWVFKEAGFSLFKTASCTTFVNNYKNKAPKQIVKENYAPGDIVFFDFSGKRSKTEHVGIVYKVENGNLITIEGNTGTGNDANGGKVMMRTRALKLVTCAVRPNYPDA